MLEKRDYEDTLMMLDASNASGLIHALPTIVETIWKEARVQSKGSSWVAQHPITLLWISKLADLSYGQEAPQEKWVMAYNYCRNMISGNWLEPAWTPGKKYEA